MDAAPPDYPALRVPDDTPVCERVALLEGIATAGSQYLPIEALVRAARLHTARSLLEAAQRLLEQVHRLPYVMPAFRKVQEWYQPVVYTLQHGGNCSDLNAVFVAACRRVAQMAARGQLPHWLAWLHAQIIWVTQKGRALNHVVGAVWTQLGWLYAEASLRGAQVGETPWEALARLRAPARSDLEAA